MNAISKLVTWWPHLFKKKEKHIQKPAVKKKVKRKTGALQLIDIFDCEKKYRFIIDLLVTKGMLSSVTPLWIDEEKGSKGVLVALLKRLYVTGYYKENSKLTNKQIMDICWNTFGVDISIDHIKHTKSKDIIFNYIPHANTLNL